MRCFLFTLVIAVFTLSSFSQKRISNRSASSTYIYKDADTEPQFKGGSGEWIRFISKNVVIPNSCDFDEIRFPVVLKFIVFKTGRIGNIEVIKGGSDCVNKNFIRLIELSRGKWIPSIRKGKVVNCYKKIPINIHLSE